MLSFLRRVFGRQKPSFRAIGEEVRDPGDKRSVATLDGFSGRVYNRGTLKDITDATLPDDRQGQLLKCQENRMKDDFIRVLVDVKADIFGNGLRLALSNRGGTSGRSGKRLEAVRDFAENMRLERVAKELMKDWVCTDSFVLVWFVAKGNSGERVSSVIRVDPASVEYINAFGVDRLRVPLPESLQTLITTATTQDKDDALAQLREAGLSEKYIKAIETGETTVELSNEDGEFWYVGTDGPLFDGFAQPSMCSIFMDLEMRAMLKSGDFSFAYLLKNLREHVTAGESIDNGPMAGRRNNWATTADLTALQTLYNSREMQLTQVGRTYTNHTVKSKYEHPPLELFNPMKYQEVKERLISWGGICGAILLGQGEYAGSSFGVRRFQNKGKGARKEIGDAFRAMFSHQPVMSSLGLATNDKVAVEWDNEILEDAKMTLEKVNAALDRGLLDARTYTETLGWEYDAVMTSKADQIKQYKENQWLFWPLFEPNQGIVANSPGLYGKKVAVVPPLSDKSEPQGPQGQPGRPSNPEGKRTNQGEPAKPAPTN